MDRTTPYPKVEKALSYSLRVCRRFLKMAEELTGQYWRSPDHPWQGGAHSDPVLKRLAGPRTYPRLHQVLQAKIYRAGNYAGSDEISQDDLKDICARLDVPMQQRELALLSENYGGGRLLRVNALLAGISQVMRKDETLRKRWAASIMKRIVGNMRQSGLSVRDSFYAYCRGDTMSMSDFRRLRDSSRKCAELEPCRASSEARWRVCVRITSGLRRVEKPASVRWWSLWCTSVPCQFSHSYVRSSLLLKRTLP